MKKREFPRMRDCLNVSEWLLLSCATNEDLVECVRQQDTELADEIQARFNYYFEELAWIATCLENQNNE